MGVDALSTFTVKLGGHGLTVIPDPSSSDEHAEPGYAGEFLPQDSSRQLETRDVPVFIRRFSKGAGFVEMRDEDDDGGYAWAEDALTHLESGVTPSGRRVSVGNYLGTGNSAGAFPIQSELFSGHVWAMGDAGGRMLRYANADPSAVPVYDPPLNTFGSATESFHAGFVPQAMGVFATGAGVPALYVGCRNVGAGTSRIYQYTVAGGWTNPGGLLGLLGDRMAPVFWEGRDGTGAMRLAIRATSDGAIRHCIYGNDPTASASYVTPITVGNPGYASGRFDFVAAPQRLFIIRDDGIWDFNEVRSWNLTPTWPQTAVNRLARGALIVNDHLYAARGNGIYRYPLRLDGEPNRFPGECGPMMYMQDGTPIRGYVTAMCEHDNDILAAVFNPDNLKTYIMRGIDRRTVGVDTRNPVVWYGAEQVLDSGVAGRSVIVRHMRVGPPTSSTTLLSGASYLWMWTTIDTQPSGPNVDGALYYAPLPSGSGPLSLQASGGSFTFNPTARIYLTAQTWGDRNAPKGVRRYDMANRKTTSTSTIELKSRADGDPTTITNQATWTSQGTATSNDASFTPTSGVTGKSIATQVVLTTPSPYTAPPIFHELSPRAAVRREVFDVRTLWVLLERDHGLGDGQPDPRSPDVVRDAIVGFQNQAAPVTFVDELNTTRTVYVEQTLRYGRVKLNQREWRTVMRVELSVVS